MTNAYDAALEVLTGQDITQELLLAALRAGLDAHGFTNAGAKISTRMLKTYGYCRYYPLEVKLGWETNRYRSVEEIANTVAHEVAHAMTRSGHDAKWRAACEETGCNGERCSAANEETMKARRYALVCLDCNEEHRYRFAAKPRHPRICRACGKRVTIIDTREAEDAEPLQAAAEGIAVIRPEGTIDHARDCWHPLTKKDRARCRRMNR